MSKRNRKGPRRTGFRNVLPFVGETEDGKKVVAGTYEFHETYGMPLSGLFCWLADNNTVPDWINFYREAERNGMKHDGIIGKMRDAIEDAWGKEFSDKVCEQLVMWKAYDIISKEKKQ